LDLKAQIKLRMRKKGLKIGKVMEFFVKTFKSRDVTCPSGNAFCPPGTYLAKLKTGMISNPYNYLFFYLPLALSYLPLALFYNFYI
jgi:hypothetical protein